MRSLLLHAVVGVAVLLPAGPPARAQPGYGPWTGYYDNGDRAYRHFLNSRYSYRTYSASSPGYAVNVATPLSAQGFYTGPGYVHQRITPRGFEGFQAVPSYGGYTITPFGAISYSVPGYEYFYYVPARVAP
jgi:hypothetical protein